jgi:hypothetical protein
MTWPTAENGKSTTKNTLIRFWEVFIIKPSAISSTGLVHHDALEGYEVATLPDRNLIPQRNRAVAAFSGAKDINRAPTPDYSPEVGL